MTYTANEILTVTIHAAFIEAALQAVSKEETRYYLRGVFFDARGFIAATNGHIAFAAKCPDAARLERETAWGLPGVIVPEAAIHLALKAAGKGKSRPEDFTIERDATGRWSIIHGAARVAFSPIDGAFPDWQRFIPTAPEALAPGHYQPQHIAALGNMAKALRGGKKDGACTYRLHQDGNTPALVTFCRAVTKVGDERGPRPDCLAVLMPMRTDAADWAGATFTANFLHHKAKGA